MLPSIRLVSGCLWKCSLPTWTALISGWDKPTGPQYSCKPCPTGSKARPETRHQGGGLLLVQIQEAGKIQSAVAFGAVQRIQVAGQRTQRNQCARSHGRFRRQAQIFQQKDHTEPARVVLGRRAKRGSATGRE